MTQIPGREKATFRNENFRVFEIEVSGKYSGWGQGGSKRQEIEYHAGDLVLTDRHGLILCGPINKERSVDLALRVLEGEQRAVLDSQTPFALAIGILAALDLERFAECGA